MCIICVELIKQRMTLLEADRNLDEVVNDIKVDAQKREHYRKLKRSIDEFDIDKLDETITEGLKGE